MKLTTVLLFLPFGVTSSGCQKVLGALWGMSAVSLMFSQVAMAREMTGEMASSKNISMQQIENLQTSGAFNGVLCLPDCGRFFEEGRESFEAEVQRLVESRSRLDEDAPVLQVDPSLPNLPEFPNFLNSPKLH